MNFPQEFYQIKAWIEKYLPCLREAQQKGLGMWVYGTILAHSACQNAVLSVWVHYGKFSTMRQYLREWLYDGEDRAAPCQTELDVSRCFVGLLQWLLSWWKAPQIVFAIDASSHQDRITALVISVLYRGSALPIAWRILTANKKGEWMGPILEMIETLQSAVPATMKVVVMADRGLWSRRLFNRLCKAKWHPMMRAQNHILFTPQGKKTVPAASLAPKAGEVNLVQGMAFSDSHGRLPCTLIAVQEEGKELCLVLTDIPAKEISNIWRESQMSGLWLWYGLRMWIELGFRVLKSMGWQWNKTRRIDPKRVERYWLVLAVATLFAMACGTRVEDAQILDIPAHRLLSPKDVSAHDVSPAPKRTLSVFRQGRLAFARQLQKGRIWKNLWLDPRPWFYPPPELVIILYAPA